MEMFCSLVYLMIDIKVVSREGELTLLSGSIVLEVMIPKLNPTLISLDNCLVRIIS